MRLSDKTVVAILSISTILLVNSCATVQEQERQGAQRFAQDVLDEKNIGRLMAAKLAGHFGYEDSDEALVRYLNFVGTTVATQGSRNELTFRFGILKSEEANAFATPGGYIFVTLPLLRALESESELAGILGHEVAHVTERHMYKEIAPKRQVSTGEILTRFLSRGGSDLGYSVSKIVNEGLEILLEKGLGEEKESAADEAGSLLATSAGYDSGALLRFLVRLERDEQTVKISKTHPPFPKRLARLKAFLAKNGLESPQSNETKERQARFVTALNSVKTQKKNK